MLIKYICDDCGHGFEKENNLDPICPVCGVAQLVNDGFKPPDKEQQYIVAVNGDNISRKWNGKDWVEIDLEDILNNTPGGD